MGARSVWLAACLLAAAAGTADAGGVCVAIDIGRDTLAPQEQYAARLAIVSALEKEGIAVDESGRQCVATVDAYNIRLGNRVTTTLSSGDRKVVGDASSIHELDLSISQLVRSLVTGKQLMTGNGIQDRTNVLRDQTAPRRAHPSARQWDTVGALGGGMLQLPAIGDRPMQRQYNIVALEFRSWGYVSGSRSAFELMGRILVHDYAVFDSVGERADRTTNDNYEWNDVGTVGAITMAPFAAANYEVGVGFVAFAGDRLPRPYVRLGISTALLSRFSDPDHRFDLGIGPYGGVGIQLTKHASLSVAANVSNPIFHDFADRGYSYFLTTTAMLEIRSEADRVPALFQGATIPTYRRIND